jgi:hypothetical protein
MNEESSDEDNANDTSSILSDLSDRGNLDPADASIPHGSYIGCQDHNTHTHTIDCPMVDVVAVQPTAALPSKCWLCTFCPNPIAVSMHSFIVSNVACMDFQYIASQIKHEILAAYPHAKVCHPLHVRINLQVDAGANCRKHSSSF